MIRNARTIFLILLATGSGAGSARAALTVDEAVKMALANNSQIIGANASVLDARGGLYTAYSGILPRASASYTRGGSLSTGQSGSQVFGSFVNVTPLQDQEGYSTTPTLSGTWSVLSLSALSGWMSARNSLKAAQLSHKETRQEVALDARRKFYDVAKAIHLARVSSQALRFARDDERRVRALFTVGSVSRSDLLRAQVRTSQSTLDSLQTHNAISVARITLATTIGVAESALGDVDTVLTAAPQTYDEGQVLAEAEKARPDIMAAQATLRAAKASLRAANFARLPFVSVSGAVDLSPSSQFKTTTISSGTVSTGGFEEDRNWRGSIGLTWNLLNGLTNEAGIASSRARLMRAQNGYDVLRRNLVGEIEQVLLTYREVVEGYNVANRAVESAEENMKLTQQKYNVGSATILDLIDAQVVLQRAQSDVIQSLAGMRVGEATVAKVRGGGD